MVHGPVVTKRLPLGGPPSGPLPKGARNNGASLSTGDAPLRISVLCYQSVVVKIPGAKLDA